MSVTDFGDTDSKSTGKAIPISMKDRYGALKVQLSRIFAGQCEDTQLKRSAIFAFGVRVMSAGLAYLSQVLLARMLGTFDYGVYAYVWIWVIILGHISSMGFNQSLVRFLPVYLERDEKELARGIMRASRLISLSGSLFIASFGALGVWFFSEHIADYYIMPLYIAAICLPLFALQDIQEGTARAFGWINVALMPTYLARPTLLIIFLGIATLMGAPVSASTAIWAAIAATLVSGIAQMLYINYRTKSIIGSGKPRNYRVGYWIAASLPLILVDIFYNVQMYADLTVLNFYVTPDKIAVYFAAAKTVGLVSFIHFAVGAAVGQKFSAYNAAGRKERLREFVQQTTQWTFWPALLACIGILMIGHPLLWLFGPEFTSAYWMMYILAIGIMVHASAGQAEFFLSMLGYQYYVAAVYGFTLLANILINLLLIPYYGVAGAAMATSATLALQGIVLAYMVRRLTGIKIMTAFRRIRPAEEGREKPQLSKPEKTSDTRSI